MLQITRKVDKLLGAIHKQALSCSFATAPEPREDEFRVLNLRPTKGQVVKRRQAHKFEVLPDRTNEMAVDQDWGNVWPGPRSFHPATVPLPVRQGYNQKGVAPGKHANAELMKIPNFLHLTPPVIKRQCEALRQFCTPWPKGLETQEQYDEHFPLEVSSSDYCHSSPSIRDPLARIITVRFKLGVFNFDRRARDKFLRLVGERYDEKSDLVTIVTDRCPLKQQNYDYALYLITALYHESLNVEPWEELKSEADMEYYIWENNASKQNVEKLFKAESGAIPHIEEYSTAVTKYMNDGESEFTIQEYTEAVRKLLNIPQLSQ